MSTPNEGTVGWRFSPKDEELINYFLRRKINGKDEDVKIIREIDVCKFEPWDLPGQSVLKSEDKEWFFFCPRDQKSPSSSRLNRATRKGYWKATGKDRKIKSKKSEIGMKKTLVFHTGRASECKRTYWVMHEYRATLKELDGTHPGQFTSDTSPLFLRPYVLCRLFKKDDDSVLDAAENNVEFAQLSPIPCELSVTGLKSDHVSHKSVSFSEQECEKALATSENCNGQSSKETGQEPQLDMNFEYLNWFCEPDPNDLSLLESPMVESMGSSLPPHSATDNICIKGHVDFTSDALQSILIDSLAYCRNQGSNWMSDDDFEIPGYEFMNQFEVLGTDCGVFLQSNSENTEMDLQSQLDAELEPYASNAESSDPIPESVNTWTLFQGLNNSQTHHEYCGGAFIGGSSTDNILTSNDNATHTGIQIRHRQPQLQTRPDNTNFNNRGTARRRIRLQTNLGRSLIPTESESEPKVTSVFSKPKHTKQTITKKLITSLSSLTISHKFLLGLASISLTMFVVYTGFDYVSSW